MSGGYATSQWTGHAWWLSRIQQGSTRFIDKSSCLFGSGEMDQSRAHGHLHAAARVHFSSALFNDSMQSGSHQLSHHNTTLLWSQSSHASWSSLRIRKHVVNCRCWAGVAEQIALSSLVISSQCNMRVSGREGRMMPYEKRVRVAQHLTEAREKR